MKTNVEVVALHKLDGSVVPLFIVWENRTKFKIDRILEVRKAASLKHGGFGLRYTCRVQGQIRYLYYENPTWFVENRV